MTRPRRTPRKLAALLGTAALAAVLGLGLVGCEATDVDVYVPTRVTVEHADGSATVEWGTDADTAAYARKQYYGNYRHDTVQNGLNAPKAQGHWFDGARAERLAEWERMYRTVYGGAIHG